MFEFLNKFIAYKLVSTEEISGIMYSFHVKIKDGITYLLMTTANTSIVEAQLVLTDIKNNFIVTFGKENIKKAIAYSCDNFKFRLKSIMKAFNLNKNTKYKMESQLSKLKYDKKTNNLNITPDLVCRYNNIYKLFKKIFYYKI